MASSAKTPSRRAAAGSKRASRRKVAPRALRLIDVLRALPERELEGLAKRIRIKIDKSKRIDAPSQVARMLVSMSDLWESPELPGPTRELLYRIAEEGGMLVVDELPAALTPLMARGVVFARGGEAGIELILPIAILVQLKTWDGEDPRGLRALFASATPDVQGSIASHYSGRTATPPMALSIEEAWEVVSDEEKLKAGVHALAPVERKLLQAVELVGGEVDTEELLDLEREPLRLRGASGATPSRRGVGFALERRGFLVALHPNRHVVPTEVARIVGAQHREEREQHRQEIREHVIEEDLAPRRARFCEDPTPLAVAMSFSVRDDAVDVRPGVGIPRTLLNKFSSRFGREPEVINLLAALSRATGLWDPSVVNVASPPGALSVGEVPGLLFEAWRRGGAWDEARPAAEVLRAPKEQREASAVGVLREMLLDALQDLGEGCWVSWRAMEAFINSDPRTPGVGRLIERWAGRCGVAVSTPVAIARRMTVESLHHLGVVDLGDGEGDGPDDFCLRLTPRGRAFLAHSAPPTSGSGASQFIDNHELRIGPATLLGHAVGIAPFVEIGRVAGYLDVAVTPTAISGALSAGFETSVIRDRVAAVAPLPDAIQRLIERAGAVLGRAEFVACGGFLWVDDPEVRELLSTRRSTTDLFVDPSPTGGLLLAEGVDLERLASRCRALGVEVIVDGEVYRTRSTRPPRRGSSGALRLDSRALAAAGLTSKKSSRKSSGSMKAVRKTRKSTGSMKAVSEESAPRATSGTRSRTSSSSSSTPAANKRRSS